MMTPPSSWHRLSFRNAVIHESKWKVNYEPNTDLLSNIRSWTKVSEECCISSDVDVRRPLLGLYTNDCPGGVWKKQVSLPFSKHLTFLCIYTSSSLHFLLLFFSSFPPTLLLTAKRQDRTKSTPYLKRWPRSF